MTFTKLSGFSYIALAADVKNTVGINVGARLVEYDTNVQWVFDGTTWRTVTIQPTDTLELAKGNIPGHSTVNKFGRNTDIDSGITADIWDGGKTTGGLPAGTSLIWVAPTAAAKHDITSTSGDDDAAGVGAKTIEIFGLTDWDTAEVSETVIMDGTNDVETNNSYVIIHRMKVLTKGGTSVNVGTITATAKAPSATTVTARIEVGQGQTHMAIYGIPSVQTGYMKDLWASANKAGGASGLLDVQLLYNPEPDVELTNFLSKHTFGLQTVGSSQAVHPFLLPKRFTGPGILKVQGFSGTNNMDVSAGFDIVMVNN